MSQKTKLIWIVLVTICVAALVSGYCNYSSNSVDSDAAFVTWLTSPPAREIVVSVRETDGLPKVNANVHVDNVSGGTTKATDENGIAGFSAADFGGEDKLTGLSIDGEVLMRRGAFLGMGAPSVAEGLHVHVILKLP